MSLIDEYEQVKKRLEQAQVTKARLEGQREGLLEKKQNLEDEMRTLGFSSVSELKEAVRTLGLELTDQLKEVSTNLDDFDKKVKSLGSVK